MNAKTSPDSYVGRLAHPRLPRTLGPLRAINLWLLCLACALGARAATRYVNLDNPSPAAPYTNWTTAATDIQTAVDAAASGDLVLVSNGVYNTGAVAVYGTSNRVAVTRPVTVQSLNGPGQTVIAGYQVPLWVVGGSAVRCAYLTNGAVLIGFTLTNGATQMFAGIGNSDEHLSGGGVWCESDSAVLSNCVIVGNTADIRGGGVYYGTLNHCTLTGNAAVLGGGAYGAALCNCTLSGNAASEGGGAESSTLTNCTVSGNSGGGACEGALVNCTVSGNAGGKGGGAEFAELYNCALSGNSADNGGGAYGCTLYNCTLSGNTASAGGGGACGSTLYNCIAYGNLATVGNNYDPSSVLNYCCTTPLPPSGSGNLSVDPELASSSHLSAASPCRGAGSAAYAQGLDIDGDPWANPPSIGCDEYRSGSVTGAVSIAITADYTNVAAGFPVDLAAVIGGRVSASRWDFDDGTVVSNRPYASHAWGAPREYAVVLTAWNESFPSGVGATATVWVVSQPVHYVAQGNAGAVAPYTSWSTAAANIQDAVDAAVVPGALVLVSNGVYDTGVVSISGASNRVAVTKPVVVQSLNGPAQTIIAGQGATNGAPAVQCVYLTNRAVLAGFTLTNGVAQGNGGGVWCASFTAVVSNCVIVGNTASSGGGAAYGTLNNCTLSGNSAYSCGGAYSALLNNCALLGNTAYSDAGGALASALNNCTLTGNTAYTNGGGACSSVLNNCIAYDNWALFGSNYDSYSTLNYCCTTPLPSGGAGNITNAPSFVDYQGGNLRLQSNSPCINAGLNAYVVGTTDLEGRPRVVGGTVDMGAYEYQGAGMGEFIGWLQQYGLPTDGSADYVDSDGDGMNNWQEWIAGTNPTNAASVLRMTSAAPAASGITVSWTSVSGRSYTLERSSNLGVAPAFSAVQSGLADPGGILTYTDTNAVGPGPFFYRVRVGQ